MSKPPGARCFSLLAVAGIGAIVSCARMGAKQQASARSLGIDVRILASTFERRARREAIAAPWVDRERVQAARLERKLLKQRLPMSRLRTTPSK